MPELPEVEQARRFLEGNVLNRRIAAVEVLDEGVLSDIDPLSFKLSLTGRMMTSAGRRGKQMFIGLDDGTFLTIHLGMTGDLALGDDAAAPKYTRITIRFEEGLRLHYADQRKFGALGIVGTVDQFVAEHHLGPDALCIGSSDFIERVSGHKKAIKSVLLDQSVLSGIGNLYADEILFQARVHPEVRAESISPRRLNGIHREIGMVLKTSITAASDFSTLPNGYLLRVRGEGAKCPRNNGILTSIKVGGRTTILCPKCQRFR
jgi:formamidopyrimidine-DNA glycosylase